MEMLPCLRPICFWGRMNWQEAESLVPGIGGFRIQMARTRTPFFSTLDRHKQLKSMLVLPVGKVAWVANNLLGLDCLSLRSDEDSTILGFDFFNRLVQHVSSSVDGRETSEALKY